MIQRDLYYTEPGGTFDEYSGSTPNPTVSNESFYQESHDKKPMWLKVIIGIALFVLAYLTYKSI